MNAKFERMAPQLCAPKRPDPKHPGTIGNELWLKVDHPEVLVRGVKVKVGEVFLEKDGTVYLPLSPFCLYTGAQLTVVGKALTLTYKEKTYQMTLGAKKWSEKTPLKHPPVFSEGTYYLDIAAIGRIFRLRRFYNPQIGLLIFSDQPMLYRVDHSSLVTQIYRLADLIFDTPTGQRVYEDMVKNGLLGLHPRLNVSGATYDRLHALYRNEAPETEAEKQQRAWLLSSLKEGQDIFDKLLVVGEDGRVAWKDEQTRLSMRHPYYLYDENGKRLVGVKEYTYQNDKGETVTEKCPGSGYGDGYDYGGRSDANMTWRMERMSYLYIVTREDKYKQAVWLMAEMADTWEHWGEGHFLECAGNSAATAVTLDRMWYAFDDAPEKRRFLANMLYKKGLAAGAHSIRGERDQIHISTINSGSWGGIHRRQNNWNSVCSSGMISAAVMLAEFPEYKDEALFVMEEMLAGTKCCLHQYAPDGAYIESPSYWAYGTSSFLNVLSVLKSAVGETYGYLNTVGLRESFDFASNICNPAGYMWGFHDGGYYKMPGDCLYKASYLFDDPAPALFRNRLIASGSEGGASELFYWKDYSGVQAELPLDYRSVGIETVTFRDGWDMENFLFTGLHAGANWALHGDSDSGNFYLEMGGVTWFSDPGSENYNVGGYWGDALRYRYFNKSLEGHNVILVKSEDCPRGQVFNRPNDEQAQIVRYETAADGALAVANMTPQYGKRCTGAERGLWLTEDRSVVVVQDEISFSEKTDIIWIATPESYDGNNAHRSKDPHGEGGVMGPSKVSYNADQTVAYIKRLDKKGKEHVLRASLLSDNKSLHFTTIPADTTLFEETITSKNSDKLLAADAPARLAVYADGVETVQMAVVFELDTDAPVSYTLCPMKDWKNKA